MKCVWVAFCGLLLVVSSNFGAPSIDGPTGLLTIPTAESLHLMEVNTGFDYLWGNSTSAESWKIKTNLGTFKNFELGVVGGRVPTEGAFLNIKYFLMADTERYPLALAIGAQNLFSKAMTEIYMVASKSFPTPLRVHFGFKALFAPKELVPFVMGGAEYFVSPRISAIVDFTGGNQKYKLNVGTRWNVTDEFMLQLAFLDLARTDPMGSFASIGFSFSRLF